MTFLGFFGSGKRHLVKMLAYLLGDVEEDSFPRERVWESFHAKEIPENSTAFTVHHQSGRNLAYWHVLARKENAVIAVFEPVV